MTTTLLNGPDSMYPAAKAKELAKQLQDIDEDGWTYVARPMGERNGLWQVFVFDVDDFLLGRL